MINMNYSKVTGHSNLIRDEETKAIINTNMSDYNNYIMQKRAKEKEKLTPLLLSKFLPDIVRGG